MLAACFNMDNGGSAFRGVFLQGNEAVVPIFAAWRMPRRPNETRACAGKLAQSTASSVAPS